MIVNQDNRVDIEKQPQEVDLLKAVFYRMIVFRLAGFEAHIQALHGVSQSPYGDEVYATFRVIT